MLVAAPHPNPDWHATSPWACAAPGHFDHATKRQVECVIRRTFGDHWRVALKVARCESELDTRNVSPTADYGAFQINRPAHPDAFAHNMFHAVWNARYAFRLSDGGRHWQAWTCARCVGAPR